jgi:transcriptional repressor NrdR
MKCPYCRSATTDVFNSRPTKFGSQIWRRRRCLSCQESFTTYEAVDLSFIEVTKTSRRRQGYSRAKLYASIYGAFLDVGDKQGVIDAVTDTVEAKLLDSQASPIASSEIAEIVMQTLKHFNTAAFVRYLTHRTDLASEAQLRKELKKY